MKEDFIQIRSSLVIKPHTVLGDLLRIDEWIHKQRMPVNSVVFTDKGRNDCPQLVSICFGLHNELWMVSAVVLEDETMTQVQCCCLSCALSSSHILLHDSFLPWQDSQFQTHWSSRAAWCVWLQGWCPLGGVVFVTRALQFHLIWSKSIFAACTIFLRVLLRLLQSGFFLVCSPLLIPSLAKSFTRVLAVVPGSWEHLLLVSFPESLKWFTSSSTVFYLCAVWFSLSFSIILLMPVLKPSDNFV